MSLSGVSIVLPTINEKLNLEGLIPQLFKVCIELDCEIIVVDDSSTDNTVAFLLDQHRDDCRVRIIDRSGLERSLPQSIYEGILSAKYEYVLWMDADGSMPAGAVTQLLQSAVSQSEEQDWIIVGSRFVEGGGFKGSSEEGRTTFRQARKNLRETNDSFLAMILSRVLNKYLWLALGRCCKDPASGFILTQKSLVVKQGLTGSYGDYCPTFLYNAYKSGYKILEVPYICIPRVFGTSKTGENLFQLISRGLPYFTIPISVRFRRQARIWSRQGRH